MIFDSHAHYDDKAFDEDREQLLGSFPEKGIGYVVNAGASFDSNERGLELTKEYPFCMLPWESIPSMLIRWMMRALNGSAAGFRIPKQLLWEKSAWITIGTSLPGIYRKRHSAVRWPWQKKSAGRLSFIPGMRQRIPWI